MRTTIPGSYLLIMHALETASVDVGSLGTIIFAPGWYLYVGSALAGLCQRVKRHLAQDKRKRWHIDYLLQAMEIQEVWYRVGSHRVECDWSQSLAASNHFEAVGTIGASDCACRTHVYYCDERPDPTWLSADPTFAGLQCWVLSAPILGKNKNENES